MRDGREWLDWFVLTHEVEAFGMGGAIWKLRRLPRQGGLETQDAKLMAALDHCRRTANHLLARRRNAADGTQELQQFHKKETAR